MIIESLHSLVLLDSEKNVPPRGIKKRDIGLCGPVLAANEETGICPGACQSLSVGVTENLEKLHNKVRCIHRYQELKQMDQLCVAISLHGVGLGGH